MSGPNQTTADFVIGEKLIGEESKAVARVVSAVSGTVLEIVYLNNKVFTLEERLSGETSSIGATVADIGQADKNVTEDYTLR